MQDARGLVGVAVRGGGRRGALVARHGSVERFRGAVGSLVKAAFAVVGIVGLDALVAFAVAAALWDDKET